STPVRRSHRRPCPVGPWRAPSSTLLGRLRGAIGYRPRRGLPAPLGRRATAASSCAWTCQAKAVSVRPVRRLLLCAVGVVTMAACGNPDVQPANPLAERAAPAAESPSATAAAPASLAFSAPRVGGGTLDMAAY